MAGGQLSMRKCSKGHSVRKVDNTALESVHNSDFYEPCILFQNISILVAFMLIFVFFWV